MANIIDFATRQPRQAPPCRHRHITVHGEAIVCADCGVELEPASAVRYLAAQLARQTAARTAAVRRARKLAGALRQARAVLGDGSYGVGSGHVAVVVEGRGVTVRPVRAGRHHRGPRR